MRWNRLSINEQILTVENAYFQVYITLQRDYLLVKIVLQSYNVLPSQQLHETLVSF